MDKPLTQEEAIAKIKQLQQKLEELDKQFVEKLEQTRVELKAELAAIRAEIRSKD